MTVELRLAFMFVSRVLSLMVLAVGPFWVKVPAAMLLAATWFEGI